MIEAIEALHDATGEFGRAVAREMAAMLLTLGAVWLIVLAVSLMAATV